MATFATASIKDMNDSSTLTNRENRSFARDCSDVDHIVTANTNSSDFFNGEWTLLGK